MANYDEIVTQTSEHCALLLANAEQWRLRQTLAPSKPTIHYAGHPVRRQCTFVPWPWRLRLIGLSLVGLLLTLAVAFASLTLARPLTAVPPPATRTLSTPAGATSEIPAGVVLPTARPLNRSK